MRRYLALMPVFAALVAALGSLGCCHIGGKCDCGYNPSDYPIHAPTDPYPSVPVAKPVLPVVPPKVGGNE
jgi:hypothetical protein